MIEALLPDSVATAECFGDPPEAALLPEETPIVARAVDKRRREFTTARYCARRALASLGLPASPILSGSKREPLWPEGVTGSLTHCDGYRAAALARTGQLSSIGIDAEPHGPLPHGVLDAVSLPSERGWIGELAAATPGVCWDRLLFTAKEAVYKAWYPLAQRWLGFEQAEISVDASGGTFSARLLVPGPDIDGEPLAGFRGRWVASGGLVITAVTVPA